MSRRPAPEQPSPAERYEAWRRGHGPAHRELERFRTSYDFGLDDFQVEACAAIEDGEGVLVAAPTGAGKTVVGEFAVHLALAGGHKAFYTTPIKALSNQKYTDLAAAYGAERVGLLTGDNSINSDAPIVVMTTEVLRNMLYAGSPALAGLRYVVMDEVHYLADRFRGPVWEEVIINLPSDVQVVSLSATVSNAEEFGAWLAEVRGNMHVVVSEVRPVPLGQHVMAGGKLYDLFADDTRPGGRTGETPVNPELTRMAAADARQARTSAGAGGRRHHGHGGYRSGRRDHGHGGRGAPGSRRVPSRPQVVHVLDDHGLLPAIYFLFSRAGCDQAVAQCLAAGVSLTTPAEAERIRHTVEERCAGIPREDLSVLGYWDWLDGLERGVAAHHAGLLPTFKEIVEDLFSAGLVRIVFATETLALGINMPARSVVLERLRKFNGQAVVDITPGEYTQLTGRAGRRGIDVEGHAVVLWSQDFDPGSVAGLASKRTYPLRSSFRPTYNMAVNLVDRFGRDRARQVLESSFAQFQADRAVVGLARRLRALDEGLAGYERAMTCHLGDFSEYATMRQELSALEKDTSRRSAEEHRRRIAESLAALRRGDAVHVARGRRSGWQLVIDQGVVGRDGPAPAVLTEEGRMRRLTAADLDEPVGVAWRLKVPPRFTGSNVRARRDLAARLRQRVDEHRATHHDVERDTHDGGPGYSSDPRIDRLRRAIRSHPCHGCADRDAHLRWARRWLAARAERDALARRVEGRTSSIARVFDHILDLLLETGYLERQDDPGATSADGEGARLALTGAGRLLCRIYGEKDLLVAECLRTGAWAGLDAAGLAAVAAACVYEPRRSDPSHPWVPAGPTGDALHDTVRLWSGIEDLEASHRLPTTGEPQFGLVRAIFGWARGRRLDAVLTEDDITVGDFVRWGKQVVDLLDQVAQATARTDPAMSATAAEAVDSVRRGVISYASMV